MGQFNYEQVKNPEFFKENRLDAHSDHVWYRDWEEERAEESSFRYSLNGLWKFAYAPNYVSAPAGFESLEYDCKGWADIRVPAHIQMEGYDRPQYANVQYPWDGREQVATGQIPERFNPVANYVKYFTVPLNFSGMPLYISFQGVESAFALWCNGEYVGYSEDTFTPSEFELTPYLQPGENKLAVQVFKWCAGSWCEDQDFFRFSGIFREVYLYTVPKVHLWDLKVQALPDESFKEAELVLDFKTVGAGKLAATLLWENQTVADMETLLKGENHVVIPVDAPKLWSAEQPNLYRLEITVRDEDGGVCEVVSQQIGFRRFEIRDGLMMLNGKRIVFKGVNRHEFSSKSGRVVSREELWQDLVTMKQNNINAIRTCHYPNASAIYGLCDKLGLYMIDECNLESHGSWDAVEKGLAGGDSIVPGDKPEWNAIMLDRANSMYQRDKNHAAILIWSCGNESFGGKNIYDMSQFFKKNDPGRLVHYEGVFHDRSYPNISDMESQMYTSAADIEKWLKKDRSKPFICCEYTHAMGNSCGAMHKYTDLTDREQLYQGGFIWDYIDQSIAKKDRYGKEFQAYGGDFDDRPTDYNFSGNGIVYGGDRTPSPKMQEVKYNYRNIAVAIEEDKIRIENKNLFTDTSEFDCFVNLACNGKQVREVLLPTDVEPGTTGEYDMPFVIPAGAYCSDDSDNIPGIAPTDGKASDVSAEYTVTVSFRLKQDTPWAKAGHEVAFGQRVFGCKDALVTDRQLAVKKPFEVIYGNYNLGVRGQEFEVLFSYLNGGLASYRYGGKELLKAIPKPNFWRAPIDNDCGNLMMQRYGQWKLASMYSTHRGVREKNPTVVEGENSVTVTYTYLLPTNPASSCTVEYEVFGDGTVKTTLSYLPVEELGDMPEFGMLFRTDADYDTVEWYGNGPEETYVDRQEGAKLGIYRNKVMDNMARYMVPQECGNKTEVRYAKVVEKTGRGLFFAGQRMSFSALPYTPFELENAAHPNELPPVHYTNIRVALGQMGVGGDNSWGARVHKEYLLPVDKELKFTFLFKGI